MRLGSRVRGPRGDGGHPGPVHDLREEFASRMGMEILEVAEFDLALAHLRVPETV
jgi:hypothetical protein